MPRHKPVILTLFNGQDQPQPYLTRLPGYVVTIGPKVYTDPTPASLRRLGRWLNTRRPVPMVTPEYLALFA